MCFKNYASLFPGKLRSVHILSHQWKFKNKFHYSIWGRPPLNSKFFRIFENWWKLPFNMFWVLNLETINCKHTIAPFCLLAQIYVVLIFDFKLKTLLFCFCNDFNSRISWKNKFIEKIKNTVQSAFNDHNA